MTARPIIRVMRCGSRAALPFLVLLAVAGTAFARTGPDSAPRASDKPPELSLSLGAGILLVPQPYEDVGRSLTPVPLGNLSYRRFYIEGTDGGFRWGERSRWGWKLFVSPRFMGYDAGESEALDGMEGRDFSGDAGAGVAWRPIPVIVELDVRADILGRSDGEEANLDIDLLLPVGGWLLRPSAGLQWQSDEMVDYYYGVEKDEARPGRPAYEGASTINWFLQIEASRKVGERWTLVAGLTTDRLGGEIADSPIVERSRSESGYLGLLFDF